MRSTWVVAFAVSLLALALSAHAFPNAGELEPEDYDSSIETAPMPWPMIAVIVGIPALIFLSAVFSSWKATRKLERSRQDQQSWGAGRTSD